MATVSHVDPLQCPYWACSVELPCVVFLQRCVAEGRFCACVGACGLRVRACARAHVAGSRQMGCVWYLSVNVMRQEQASQIFRPVWWRETWRPLRRGDGGVSLLSSKIMRWQCIQCIIRQRRGRGLVRVGVCMRGGGVCVCGEEKHILWPLVWCLWSDKQKQLSLIWAGLRKAWLTASSLSALVHGYSFSKAAPQVKLQVHSPDWLSQTGAHVSAARIETPPLLTPVWHVKSCIILTSQSIEGWRGCTKVGKKRFHEF